MRERKIFNPQDDQRRSDDIENHTSQILELEKVIKTLKLNFDQTLRSQVESQTNKHDAYVRSLEGSLQELKRNNEALKGDVAFLIAAVNTYRNLMVAKYKKVLKIKSLSEIKKEEAELKLSIKNVAEQGNKYRATLEEKIKGLEEKVNLLTKKKNELEKIYFLDAEKTKHVKQFGEELLAERTKGNDLMRELTEEVKSGNEVRNKLGKLQIEKSQLDGQVEGLKKENESLQEQLNTLKTQTLPQHESQIVTLKNENERLNESVRLALAELKNLRQELEGVALEAKKEVADIKSKELMVPRKQEKEKIHQELIPKPKQAGLEATAKSEPTIWDKLLEKSPWFLGGILVCVIVMTITLPFHYGFGYLALPLFGLGGVLIGEAIRETESPREAVESSYAKNLGAIMDKLPSKPDSRVIGEPKVGHPNIEDKEINLEPKDKNSSTLNVNPSGP